MLSCKEMTYLASDYLDKNMSGILPWRIRLHLIACHCCRTFVTHLKLTREIVPQLVHRNIQEAGAKAIVIKIKERG